VLYYKWIILYHVVPYVMSTVRSGCC